MQLERIYLMNVILHLDSLNTLSRFITINHKCFDAFAMLHTNPFYSFRTIGRELSFFNASRSLQTVRGPYKDIRMFSCNLAITKILASAKHFRSTALNAIKDRVVSITIFVYWNKDTVDLTGFSNLQKVVFLFMKQRKVYDSSVIARPITTFSIGQLSSPNLRRVIFKLLDTRDEDCEREFFHKILETFPFASYPSVLFAFDLIIPFTYPPDLPPNVLFITPTFVPKERYLVFQKSIVRDAPLALLENPAFLLQYYPQCMKTTPQLNLGNDTAVFDFRAITSLTRLEFALKNPVRLPPGLVELSKVFSFVGDAPFPPALRALEWCNAAMNNEDLAQLTALTLSDINATPTSMELPRLKRLQLQGTFGVPCLFIAAQLEHLTMTRTNARVRLPPTIKTIALKWVDRCPFDSPDTLVDEMFPALTSFVALECEMDGYPRFLLDLADYTPPPPLPRQPSSCVCV